MDLFFIHESFLIPVYFNPRNSFGANQGAATAFLKDFINCSRMRRNYCKRVCLFYANFSVDPFALFF